METVFTLFCSILLTALSAQDAHDVHLMDATPGTQSSRQLLHQLLSYLSDEDIVKLENASESISSIGDLYNPDSYINNSDWQQVFDEFASNTSDACAQLNLESEACYNDCVYYNSILSWIPLVTAPANDTAAKAELTRMLALYAMSGKFLSYQDVGNPDMCEFSGGNYCYLPGTQFGFNSHACCIPDTCQGEDAHKVLSNNEWCYKSYVSTYDNPPLHVEQVCEPLPRELDKPGPIIVIFIFFLFLFLVIVASIIRRYCLEYNERMDIEVIKDNGFISSFNIESMWTAFGRTRSPDKSSLNFLDGIRVWSMTWVILGHTYLMFLYFASNAATFTGDRSDYHYIVQDFYTIFIQYADYSVDSFFFLSGLLATFSIWRSIQKFGDKVVAKAGVWIPMAYVSRVLRIAPMMMYVTAIQWQLSDQIAYGYHVGDRSTFTEICNAEWYKTFLFYANLAVSRENGDALNCMGHLWYIQCDMQMYLLLPILVLIFYWNRVMGIVSACVPIFVCVVIRIVYAFYYHFTANVMNPGYAPVHGGEQFVQSYFKPWTRMSVYFIGVACMMLMICIQEKNKTFVLDKLQYYALILSSSFIMLALVVWPYQDVEDQPDNRWSLLSNQMYYAFGRPAWGVALALLTFALRYMDESQGERGQKSMIKAFLSLEVYQPLGKLTYSMYLLHLLVFAWWAQELDFPAYLSVWNAFLLTTGIWFIVAIISTVLWFVMEKPISNLVTLLLKALMGGGKKKKVYQRTSQSMHDDAELSLSNVHVCENGHNGLDSVDASKGKQGFVGMGSINTSIK